MPCLMSSVSFAFSSVPLRSWGVRSSSSGLGVCFVSMFSFSSFVLFLCGRKFFHNITSVSMVSKWLTDALRNIVFASDVGILMISNAFWSGDVFFMMIDRSSKPPSKRSMVASDCSVWVSAVSMLVRTSSNGFGGSGVTSMCIGCVRGSCLVSEQLVKSMQSMYAMRSCVMRCRFVILTITKAVCFFST